VYPVGLTAASRLRAVLFPDSHLRGMEPDPSKKVWARGLAVGLGGEYPAPVEPPAESSGQARLAPGAAPLLDYKGPIGPTPGQRAYLPGPPCGGGLWVWCRRCDLQVPGRCRRNRCPYCGGINARQTVAAIALARPERVFTLTLAGREWQTIRGRVRRWRYEVRRRVPRWQDCMHVEPNPSGSGEHHVHGLQWGQFPPVEVLRSAAERYGFGSWLHVSRLRDVDGASAYGLKLAQLSASAYSMKLAVGGELETYLEANGGRLVHASRGFWRDGSGERLPGVRVARKTALRGSQGDLGAVCEEFGDHDWSGDFVRPLSRVEGGR
jgi:hypothetical protein